MTRPAIAPEARIPHSRTWLLAALLILMTAIGSVFYPVWKEDPRDVVPLSRNPTGRAFNMQDQLFVIWVVGRNPRALIEQPLRFFDAGHCFPARNSLAYGEPMITMGLLALPAYLVADNPLLSYNVALLLVTLIAGLAMYLLVTDWTGTPAAGIVAALLFVFWVRLTDVVHPYVYDTGWTLLAFLFARRLFAFGRWRDAAGLASCVALQIGASFYPLLSAVALALPILAWLLFHYGLRHVRVAQLALVAAAGVLAAAFVYSPFLQVGLTDIDPTRRAIFLPLARCLRNPLLLASWACLGLAAMSLLGLRRSVTRLDSDPRPALLVAGIFVLLLAAGPHARLTLGLPNIYGLASRILPGLDSIRAPARIGEGVHLVLCVLAGLGASRLMHLGGRRFSTAIGLALICAVFVVCVHPPLEWMGSRVVLEPRRIQPNQRKLDLLAALEADGNTGPILELPLLKVFPPAAYFLEQIRQTFDNGYHHRPTSGCAASFMPPEHKALHELEKRLPHRSALRELREMGFTTLVIRRHGPANSLFHQLIRQSQQPDAELRFLRKAGQLAAFELLPAKPGKSQRALETRAVE